VLMPGDVLPLDLSARVNIRIDVPAGWTAASAEQRLQQEFATNDTDRAVILVGKNLRVSSRTVAGARFMLATDGEWTFKDDDALELAAKILKAHGNLAGALPCSQIALFMLPFPNQSGADKWSAQTRGCTVSLVMGKQPSRVGALSQLGNALTHELFHLWIPNGLGLPGDYDWFYEGFTVYHAARTAVEMELLTFADFLTAIGRAYDGTSSASDLNQLSLIEASRRRWTNGSAGVYSKAMLVAFLYDLNLREQSKGKRSLDDVYRKLFQSQKTAGQSSAHKSDDGNAVAMTALSDEPGGQSFVQRFINAPVNIDLQRELSRFGLGLEKFGFRTRVVVNKKLTKRQRDLLRELGYNDRTR
jgi:predicted metalloprotease with PDZ domain